jgi:hypothetical protein
MRIPFLANYKARRPPLLDAVYLGAILGARPVDCRIESSVMLITSPLNGGAGFAGKSGRNTANVCDRHETKTSTNTAAHFMSAALIKIKRHGKNKFCAFTVIKRRCP